MAGQLKQELDQAKDIFVMLPKKPTMDMLAAGLGVYTALKNTGKNVVIACPSQIEKSETSPKGVENVTDVIGNRNLVISLQVKSRDSIDKVSYNLDEEKSVFNLVIQPKKGNPPLSSSDIDYSYAGVQADLLLVVGAQRLEDLGVFYESEKKLFTETPVVNIGTSPQARFGVHNFVKSEYGSMSEVVYAFLKEVSMQLNQEVASNLLCGIDHVTNQLQSPKAGADTFQTVADLMKAGGVRKQQANINNSNPAAKTHPGSSPASSSAGVPQEWLNPKIYSGTNKKS